MENVAQAARQPLEADGLVPVFLSDLKGSLDTTGKNGQAVIEVLRWGLALCGREKPEDGAKDLGDVLLLGIDHSIWARIIGVRSLNSAWEGVELGQHVNNEARDIIHVKDGRVSVEAGGVELVAVLHGQLRKLGEITLHNGVLHLLHPLRDHRICAVAQQRAGLHAGLHPRGAAHPLFVVADDQDQDLELRPVGLWHHLHRQAVRAVRLHTHVPLHKAAIKTAAGAARSLSGDGGELAEGYSEAVQLCEGKDEAGIPRGRRGQAGRGREVVDRADVHLQVSQASWVSLCTCQLPDRGEADLQPRVGHILSVTIQPQLVITEVNTRRNAGRRLQVILTKGSTRRQPRKSEVRERERKGERKEDLYLSEELQGRLSATSRLPQYLITAMLTGAVQVTLCTDTLCFLDSSDI